MDIKDIKADRREMIFIRDLQPEEHRGSAAGLTEAILALVEPIIKEYGKGKGWHKESFEAGKGFGEHSAESYDRAFADGVASVEPYLLTKDEAKQIITHLPDNCMSDDCFLCSGTMPLVAKLKAIGEQR